MTFKFINAELSDACFTNQTTKPFKIMNIQMIFKIRCALGLKNTTI